MGAIGDRLDYKLTAFDNQVHCGGSDDSIPRVNADSDYLLYEGMIVMGTGQTAGKVVRMDGSQITNLPLGAVRRPHASGKKVDEPLAQDDPLNVLPLDGTCKHWTPIYPAAGPIPIADGDIIIAHKTQAGYGQKLTDALITGATSYPKLSQKIGIAKNPDAMADGATKVRWVMVQ